MTKFLAFIGGMVLVGPIVIGVGILGAFWRGWWLYPAWGWYLVPLGAPPIAFRHFVGLAILVSVVTAHTSTKKDDRREDWALIGMNFLAPIIAWGMLWWMK